MKRLNLLVTAIAASIFATALSPALAAKKAEKSNTFSFSQAFKQGKNKSASTKKRKFIVHRQNGADTNKSLTKGRGVGFNGGFYGHSGGP